MKNQKARELFSASYLHLYFSNRTAEHDWWFNEKGEEWWSGIHTFTCSVLYFVTEGEFDLSINETTYRVKPGQMVYIPADTPHERRICTKGPLRKYYCSFDLMFGKDSLSSFFRLPHVTDVANREWISMIFEALCNYHRKNEAAFATIGGNGALLMLLSLFLEESNAPFLPTDNRIDRTMLMVTEYINTNLHRNVTVSELAQAAGYSPDHFTKIFKRFFGCLPLKYVANVKLERAKKRLRETRLPITSIAEELGFCDASHFGRFFKKRTGSSPAQYRKTNRHTV